MAKGIDPEVATALTEAVRALEASSSAEVVVEVRARSGSYGDADARAGSLAGFTALMFILFSPWTFPPIWVPGIVMIAYAVGMSLSMSSNMIRRLFTSRRERDRNVRTYAAATFVEHGVANTERESGLLLYLSLLERRIELIADRGVLDAVPVLEWNQLVETVHKKDATTETLLEVTRGLSPLLSRYLPSGAGDRDELANAPRLSKK